LRVLVHFEGLAPVCGRLGLPRFVSGAHGADLEFGQRERRPDTMIAVHAMRSK
jgi:hypothetical protein